jgi:hypothetical protein
MDATRTFLAPAGRGALGSLSEIVQSPLARSVVRYWWVALPMGFVAYHSWQKHKNHGKPLSAAINDTIVDVAPVVATVATLVMLNQMLRENEQRRVPAATMKPADFAVRPAAPAAAPKPVAALPAPSSTPSEF